MKQHVLFILTASYFLEDLSLLLSATCTLSVMGPKKMAQEHVGQDRQT